MDLARCLFVPRERYAGSAIPMSLSHVENPITSAAGYFWFWPHEVSWGDFIGSWVPEVTRDGILVGVTCSGTHVAGLRRDTCKDPHPRELRN